MDPTNKQIVEAAYALLNARALPDRPGFCLMATRLIVERALGLGDMGFYRRYLEGFERAEPRVARAWWARDAQRILRDDHRFGVSFDERQGGDLIFNHLLAPSKEFPPHRIGHVAVLLDRDTVLENTGARRGAHVYGAMRVVPLWHWPEVHQVIRLKELP